MATNGNRSRWSLNGNEWKQYYVIKQSQTALSLYAIKG